MTSVISKHTLPEEHFYEDVVYPADFFGEGRRDKVLNWKADPQDILLAAYPRSGSTWVSTLLHYILKDGDTRKNETDEQILLRINFLEVHFPGMPPHIDQLAAQEPPRVYKTHLQYKYLRRVVEDDRPKVILILRNPKDTLVSFYHYYQMNKALGSFRGSFHDFFELFKNKGVAFGDICEWQIGWWSCKDLGNVCVLKFEELIEDSLKTTEKLAKFIGKSLSKEQLKDIVAACAFGEMDKNPMTQVDKFAVLLDENISKFYRRGQVGDWKNYFSDEESLIIDEICKRQYDPIGLSLTFV